MAAEKIEEKTLIKRKNIYSLEQIVAASMVGAISFPFALGITQKLVFKPLKISCRNPNFVISLFGGTSVILSGIVASSTFLASCEALRKINLLSSTEDSSTTRFKLEFLQTDETVLWVYGVCSLAIFKSFGGKLRHVVPSHLFYPGAFAKVSVPAAGKNYAGSLAKKELNILGRKYGCHSCGNRRQKYFIADHMPPNKIVKSHQSQVFYPQCKICSQQQGGALSAMSNVGAIQTHANTLRPYHIWLPVPLGIAIVKEVLDEKKRTTR